MRRPANDKQQSLRFLLLRSIWEVKDNISFPIYKEVSKSLKVTIVDKNYVVTWMKNGLKNEKKYNLDQFRFFIRGDKVLDGEDYKIDSETNNYTAKSFVNEIFGADVSKKNNRVESILLKNPIIIMMNFLTVLGFYFFSEKELMIASLCLLFLFLIEYWFEYGKFFVPFGFLGFAYNGLVYSAIFGLIFFMIMQFLDPNKQMRRFGLLNGGIVLIITIITFSFPPTLYFTYSLLFIIFISAIICFLFNFFVESHFRFFPLIFPFLACGLLYDGNLNLSLLIILGSLVTSFFNRFKSKIFAIQRMVVLK